MNKKEDEAANGQKVTDNNQQEDRELAQNKTPKGQPYQEDITDDKSLVESEVAGRILKKRT